MLRSWQAFLMMSLLDFLFDLPLAELHGVCSYLMRLFLLLLFMLDLSHEILQQLHVV